MIEAWSADHVQLVAEALHESHAITKETWQAAWRNVRRLLGVDRMWREGVNRWLLSHVNFLRSCTFIPRDLPAQPVNPSDSCAQHALNVAGELLALDPYCATALTLLRYTPSHPDHASVHALSRRYTP